MTDYVSLYHDYLTQEKHAAANTLSSYMRDLTQFQMWLIASGSPDLRKVKKDMIGDYLMSLTRQGKSPATVTRLSLIHI